MNHKILTVVFASLAIMQSACGSKSEQFEKKVGKPTYSVLSSSAHITMTPVSSTSTPTTLSENAPKELSQEQKNELRDFLLNDDHYIFDMTKRCIFVPQLSYQFFADKETTVYISLSCQQIKIVDAKNTLFFDYDPMAEKFNAFNHSLLNTIQEKNSSVELKHE